MYIVSNYLLFNLIYECTAKSESHTIIYFKIKILSFYSSLKAQRAVRTIMILAILSIDKLNTLF